MPTITRLPSLVFALALASAMPAMSSAEVPASSAARPSSSAAQASSNATFAGLTGEVELDNARVHVEKFIIAPGQSTGQHRHPGNQLFVFVKGGVLTSSTGRKILWRDGRVEWQSADAPSDPGSVNSGDSPIEIICVDLKPVAAHPPESFEGGPKYRHLSYPNIPGEDLLENDFVIVQRFTVNPGVWEGQHPHHPDMLYIHVKGGIWAARSKTEPEHIYPYDADGKVGWMDTVPSSVGHESGNAGKEPIDLIWVTLKQ